MLSPTVLQAEAARYRALSVQLREDYAGIDEETLADTLEGACDLPGLLTAIIRSSLLDEALAVALKARLADMRMRLDRLEERHQRKRQLVCGAMTNAGLDKLSVEDFSISLRQGLSRLEVVNEAAVPAAYLILQPPKLDRAGLLSALRSGTPVAGVHLQDGEAHIQVRTR